MSRLAVCVALLLGLAPGGAAAQRDVPSKHWAAEPVSAMVRLGVMPLVGGKFNGGGAVTRAQMVGIVARLVRSIEAGKWAGEQAPAVAGPRLDPAPLKGPVTRYDIAYAAYRIGAYAARGLPTYRGRTSIVAEGLKAATLPGKPKAGPLRTELAFLVSGRFVLRGSPLLNADAKPLTGLEASRALAEMVGGLNARRTDEPEIREQLERFGPQAGHTHDEADPKR